MLNIVLPYFNNPEYVVVNKTFKEDHKRLTVYDFPLILINGYPTQDDYLLSSSINTNIPTKLKNSKGMGYTVDYGNMNDCTVFSYQSYLFNNDKDTSYFLFCSMPWRQIHNNKFAAFYIRSFLELLNINNDTRFTNLSFVLCYDKESGIPTNWFNKTNDLLVDSHPINKIFKEVFFAAADAFLTTGSSSVSLTSNISTFKDIKQIHKRDNITYVMNNFFVNEFNKRNLFLEKIGYMNHKHNIERTCKFLCLNSIPKLPRIMLLFNLYKKNLLNEGKISVIIPPIFDSIITKHDLPLPLHDELVSCYKNKDHNMILELYNGSFYRWKDDDSQHDKFLNFIAEVDQEKYYTIYHDLNDNEIRQSVYDGWKYVYENLGVHKLTYSKTIDKNDSFANIFMNKICQKVFVDTVQIANQDGERFVHDMIIAYHSTMTVKFNLENITETSQIDDTRYWYRSSEYLKHDTNQYLDVSHLSSTDHLLYDQCFFSVVTETETLNTPYYDESVPMSFFTEKTFKAIANMHPFILYSSPHSLIILRGMGFKTFDGFIDESYDMINDITLREEAIAIEIQRLCKMTLDEFKIWYNELLPILNYNKRHLLNRECDLFTSLRNTLP